MNPFHKLNIHFKNMKKNEFYNFSHFPQKEKKTRTRAIYNSRMQKFMLCVFFHRKFSDPQ